MARVHVVEKNTKEQKCGRCQAVIPKGAGYRHATPGFRGHKIVRCMDPACAFRPSDLTTGKMSEVYSAQENAQDMVEGWDGEDAQEVTDALNECAESIRSVAQEYADAADAMGGAGEEMQSKADELESWADEIDSAADNWDDKPEDDEDEDEDEEPTPAAEGAEPAPAAEPAADKEKAKEEKAEALEAWRQSVRDAALEALGNCPC